MNKKLVISILVNATLLITMIVLLFLNNKNNVFDKRISRDNSKDFKFTSPILDCENVDVKDSKALSYKDLNAKAENLAQSYNLSDYSVYFRNLNDGIWVGVNEKAFFSPASLMKTPILIAFLKGIEGNPEALKKEVFAEQEYFDYSIKQNFELETKVVKGNKYTLEQLAKLMIQDSDNIATLMLSKYVRQSDYENLLSSVGVTAEKNESDVDVRVKDFAGFFRVLYNASYLNREMSEYALSILVKSKFESGIVAGVPKGIFVAHKYGERSLEKKISGEVQEKQLHDCGIIYTKSPYILCVMTRGKDFKKQELFIADISDFVFKNIENK